MTLTVIVEIVAIFMAIAGAVVKSEVGGNSAGPDKKKEAVDTIYKELTDEGGITLKSKYIVKALPMVLPFLIDVCVLVGNKTGFLGRLNAQ